MTVSGQTLETNLADIRPVNNDVIRHPKASLRKDGGIIVMRGNLAPEGAVIKQTAFPEKRFLHTGKARVFTSIKAVEQGLSDGTLELQEDEVLVLRYQGPKGAPGMPRNPYPAHILRPGIIRYADHYRRANIGEYPGSDGAPYRTRGRRQRPYRSR